MTIRAERDPGYYRRFWLMAIGAFAFALYCIYDGAVAYPNQAIRATAYKELEESGDPNWLSQWRKLAQEKGWPATNPGEPKTEVDFQVQFAMAGLCGVIGAALLANVLMSRGRWIEADEKTIKTSWGQTVPFDQIQKVNKKDWPKKGIARVYYADGGKTRKFVLDNFKFFREPTDEIMLRMEANIDVSKITGAPPDKPKSKDEQTEPASENAPAESSAQAPAE